VRALTLSGTETSRDVEHGHIAHQQGRSGWHFAYPEFIFFEGRWLLLKQLQQLWAAGSLA
jgi:hypothetical protein